MGVAAVCAGAAALVGGAVVTRAQAPDPTIASVKSIHDQVKNVIMKSAAMVPADKYSYQPTKEVRTFGQLFGHVANASRLFCSTSTGMAAGQAPDAEKLATKPEIEKALADAMAFCDHAFSMLNASNANETVKIFGQTHTRVGGLAFNNAHNYEHYGNIVTYLRINGMVPPSSGGGD
jgi:uncharacterized damage-inducible protein DinB